MHARALGHDGVSAGDDDRRYGRDVLNVFDFHSSFDHRHFHAIALPVHRKLGPQCSHVACSHMHDESTTRIVSDSKESFATLEPYRARIRRYPHPQAGIGVQLHFRAIGECDCALAADGCLIPCIADHADLKQSIYSQREAWGGSGRCDQKAPANHAGTMREWGELPRSAQRGEAVYLVPAELQPIKRDAMFGRGGEPGVQFGLLGGRPFRLFASQQPSRRSLLGSPCRGHGNFSFSITRLLSERRIFPVPPSMKSVRARIPRTSCRSMVSTPTPIRTAASRVDKPSIFRNITASRQRSGRLFKPAWTRRNSARADSCRSGVTSSLVPSMESRSAKCSIDTTRRRLAELMRWFRATANKKGLACNGRVSRALLYTRV